MATPKRPYRVDLYNGDGQRPWPRPYTATTAEAVLRWALERFEAFTYVAGAEFRINGEVFVVAARALDLYRLALEAAAPFDRSDLIAQAADMQALLRDGLTSHDGGRLWHLPGQEVAA
jgi:hypothetical protein